MHTYTYMRSHIHAHQCKLVHTHTLINTHAHKRRHTKTFIFTFRPSAWELTNCIKKNFICHCTLNSNAIIITQNNAGLY